MQMERYINQNQVYAEVYAVLAVLGDDYIRKIPQNILNTIADKRDKDYKIVIDENKPLEEQNLSKDAIALLAALKLDYWCKTAEEKKALQDILDLNEEKHSGQPLSLNSKKTWINELKNKK